MIKLYYKKLALKYHPDVKPHGNAGMFKVIKKLYDNNNTRQLYNLYSCLIENDYKKVRN